MRSVLGSTFPQSIVRYGRGSLAAMLIAASGLAHAQSKADVPDAPSEEAAAVPGDRAFVARISGYLLSPEAEVAGLLFDNGRQLRVPPHLGAQLANLAKPGEQVRVGAGAEFNPRRGPVALRTITSVESGRTLDVGSADTAPRAPPGAREQTLLQPMKFSGTVKQVLQGPRGEINGFLMTEGVQVAFPPHVGFEANAAALPGKLITVEGYGRTSGYGTIIQATILTRPNSPALRVYRAVE